MARLASQAKMGFYPTPPEVVRQIKGMIHIPQGTRLLDPCTGKGESLEIIADGSGAETYGVELDQDRLSEARGKLDHVLWADALHEVSISSKAFSLLWLNPPYDEERNDGEKTHRLEIRFLTKYWPVLQKGGALVYIIPSSVLEEAGQFLAKRSKDLAVLAFPEEFFEESRQVVVICVKGRPNQKTARDNEAIFDKLSETYVYEIPHKIPGTDSDDLGIRYNVPVACKEDIRFQAYRLDPDEAFKTIKNSPLRERIKKILSSKKRALARPLMPLREGHLAMLLASGMMNGEVVGEDGRRLVVKGSVRKFQVSAEEETGNSGVKHTETDRYRITVRAICFDPVKLLTIE